MSIQTVGSPRDLNELDLPSLYHWLSHSGLVRRLLELARDEDLGLPGPLFGDVTSAACSLPPRPIKAEVRSRERAVVSGLAAVPEILVLFAPDCRFMPAVRDGVWLDRGDVLGTITGPARQVLAAERTLLNLIGRLSGIATRTAAFKVAMGDFTRARLYDTRKTTPGLRMLEKYAVRCGGGFCHRIGLHDAVLIKDNHLAEVRLADLARYVREAAERARTARPGAIGFVEVEVDTLEQLDAMLTLPRGHVDIVLLDNMEASTLEEASRRRAVRSPWLELEASGGVNLDTIGAIAETGVDRISVGSLTHGAVSVDVGLDIV